MNRFAEKLKSNEANQRFAPMIPKISEVAQLVIDEVRAMVSDPCYSSPLTLTFSWIPSARFQATASTRGANSHVISVAYGVPADVYKDAALLHTIGSTHLTLAKYDELFSAIDYGQGRVNVIPAELDAVEARTTFLRASMAWIYLHEQAHLFQNHGPIFARRTGQNLPHGHTDWVDAADSSEKLVGEAAWIRHCFELSADHEASVHALGYLIVTDNGTLRVSSLWMLVAAVTCLFRRFYGESRGPVSEAAIGSHPDPDVRMRIAIGAIIDTLWHPQVRKHVPWASSREELLRVMHHAFLSASVYTQIAYFDTEQFPEFLKRLKADTTERTAYEAGLKKTWDSLRPEVVADHFGPEPENVLPKFA